MKDFGDFVAFDDTEIYKFIGILFANGLMSRPMFETWFYSVRNRPMYGNTFVTGVVDKIVHGRKISGRCRWQHLRQFLTLSNYRLNPAEEQRKNPMWKVQSLLVGGPAQVFPPIFFFFGRETYFFRSAKTPKKQTDAEQREALFSPR